MSDPVIRPAAPADFTAVQRLNAALFAFEAPIADHVYNLDWPYTDFAINYFHKCLERQDGYAAFVAEVDGRIVGYLAAAVASKLHRSSNPIAELENMFVEEPYRRHGLGSGLMQAFKAWAREQGAQRLTVGALADNHPALAFYRRHGFANAIVHLEQPLSPVDQP